MPSQKINEPAAAIAGATDSNRKKAVDNEDSFVPLVPDENAAATAQDVLRRTGLRASVDECRY